MGTRAHTRNGTIDAAGARLGLALAAGAALAWSTLCAPSLALADDLRDADAAEVSPAEAEMEAKRQELERLRLEYDLMLQRQKMRLVEAELERQELESRQQLAESKRAEELESIRAQAEQLRVRAQLREAEFEQQLSEQREKLERAELERRRATAESSAELARLRAEAERAAVENDIRMAKVLAEQSEAERVAQKYAAELAALRAELNLRETRDMVSHVVTDPVEYAAEPYKDGTLYISDRRIPLNGPIIEGTAEYVTDRIDFFNNQDPEAPIFIVIDDCPGGSVMQGYRIVKAMETSDAPVHVVVKSFAASMAAVITTLADESYALPNAIILHHQMSSGMRGNMTQQAEQLEVAREWERRLAEPVAAKMGVSLERFRELMYENNSDGDWEEFADRAVELKWVGRTVEEIREQGIRDRPTKPAPRPWFWFLLHEESGGQYNPATGQASMKLPPLRPFDFYFVYDPDGFYR